jgi:hypothetical protein
MKTITDDVIIAALRAGKDTAKDVGFFTGHSEAGCRDRLLVLRNRGIVDYTVKGKDFFRWYIVGEKR